jgi:hypothetical protein
MAAVKGLKPLHTCLIFLRNRGKSGMYTMLIEVSRHLFHDGISPAPPPRARRRVNTRNRGLVLTGLQYFGDCSGRFVNKFVGFYPTKPR